MIKRIKDLLSNFSNQEEEIKDEKVSSLDKACSALLIEVAYADKIFDESEINSLKENSINDISLISQDLTLKIIKEISGDTLNESSVKAAVDETTKEDLNRYL